MVQLPTSIRRFRTHRVVNASPAISLMGVAAATAEEGDPGGEPEATTTTVVVIEDAGAQEGSDPSPLEFFPDPGAVVFSLPDDDGAFTDCSSAVLEVDPEGAISVLSPEGCTAVPAVGPQGQVSHGQIVSSYVHGLKQSGYEGPRGRLVREAAWSDLGKGDQQIKPAGFEDDADGDDTAAIGDADAAKKGWGGPKGNRGRGRR